MKRISLHSLAQVSVHSSQVTVVHFLSSLAITRALILKNCPFYSKGKVQSTRSPYVRAFLALASLAPSLEERGLSTTYIVIRQARAASPVPRPPPRRASGKGCWLSGWVKEGRRAGRRTNTRTESMEAAYFRGRSAADRPPARPRSLRRTVM